MRAAGAKRGKALYFAYKILGTIRAAARFPDDARYSAEQQDVALRSKISFFADVTNVMRMPAHRIEMRRKRGHHRLPVAAARSGAPPRARAGFLPFL